MSLSQTNGKRGAVAALVVATAPGAAPQARDLLWRPVFGRQALAWTLVALHQLGDLSYCGLVTPTDRHDDVARMIVQEAPARMSGILLRAEATWRSAFPPIEIIPPMCEWIIIIDATLPLVTAATLRAGLRAANQTGIAIAAEPVKETLKRVDGSLVVETLPRDSLRRLLSPVIFQREALQRALDRYSANSSVSDDLVALAKLAGAPLATFDAGYPTMRVTSEDDLAIVETLLRQRESEGRPS